MGQLTAGTTRLTLLREADAAAALESFPATLYDLTAGTSRTVAADSSPELPAGPLALVEN